MAKADTPIDLDKVGAIASAVCAVHCLLTGVALGLLSIMGIGFVGSPVTDVVFLMLVLSVGATAVLHGIRKHHSVIPATIFLAGLLMFLVGHFGLGHAHGVEPSAARTAQVVLSVLGGICIMAFHVVNLRMQRKCQCNHCRTGA